eukprot:scaffold248986_cov30-Tisochrysis_lutea.AAC.1
MPPDREPPGRRRELEERPDAELNKATSIPGINMSISTCLRRSSGEAVRTDDSGCSDFASLIEPPPSLVSRTTAGWDGWSSCRCSRSLASAPYPKFTLGIPCIAAHPESHCRASERLRAIRRTLHSMPAFETAPPSAVIPVRRVSRSAVGPSGSSSESTTRTWRTDPSREVVPRDPAVLTHRKPTTSCASGHNLSCARARILVRFQGAHEREGDGSSGQELLSVESEDKHG